MHECGDIHLVYLFFVCKGGKTMNQVIKTKNKYLLMNYKKELMICYNVYRKKTKIVICLLGGLIMKKNGFCYFIMWSNSFMFIRMW